MDLAKLYFNGGVAPPWQDVEGLQLEVPFPPIHTKGDGGLVENFGPKHRIVPCGTLHEFFQILHAHCVTIFQIFVT